MNGREKNHLCLNCSLEMLQTFANLSLEDKIAMYCPLSDAMCSVLKTLLTKTVLFSEKREMLNI